MSGRVTHQPDAGHYCYPGQRLETDAEAAERDAQREAIGFGGLPDGMRALIETHPFAPEGTIWTCDDCGAEWKATYPYANVLTATWKRVRRWRWRR